MGGAVSAVTNAVSSVVGGVTNALGITQAPKPQVIYVDNTKQASAAGGDGSATGSTGATTEGPTQGGPKQAYGGTYASQRNQGAAGAAGSGGSTMLTGPTGVQEKDIALGKRTLLGE